MDTPEFDHTPVKLCWSCRRWKPLDAYYKAKGTKDGKHSRCKKCHCQYMRTRTITAQSAGRDKAQDWNEELPVSRAPAAFRQAYFAQLKADLLAGIRKHAKLPDPVVADGAHDV